MMKMIALPTIAIHSGTNRKYGLPPAHNQMLNLTEHLPKQTPKQAFDILIPRDVQKKNGRVESDRRRTYKWKIIIHLLHSTIRTAIRTTMSIVIHSKPSRRIEKQHRQDNQMEDERNMWFLLMDVCNSNVMTFIMTEFSFIETT